MAQVIPCGHVVPLVRVRFFDPHLRVSLDTYVQLDLQEDSMCRDNETGWPEAPSAGIPGHLTWMSFFSYPGSVSDSLPSAEAPVLKKMVVIFIIPCVALIHIHGAENSQKGSKFLGKAGRHNYQHMDGIW